MNMYKPISTTPQSTWSPGFKFGFPSSPFEWKGQSRFKINDSKTDQRNPNYLPYLHLVLWRHKWLSLRRLQESVPLRSWNITSIFHHRMWNSSCNPIWVRQKIRIESAIWSERLNSIKDVVALYVFLDTYSWPKVMEYSMRAHERVIHLGLPACVLFLSNEIEGHEETLRIYGEVG